MSIFLTLSLLPFLFLSCATSSSLHQHLPLFPLCPCRHHLFPTMLSPPPSPPTITHHHFLSASFPASSFTYGLLFILFLLLHLLQLNPNSQLGGVLTHSMPNRTSTILVESNIGIDIKIGWSICHFTPELVNISWYIPNEAKLIPWFTLSNSVIGMSIIQERYQNEYEPVHPQIISAACCMLHVPFYYLQHKI